MSVDLRVEILKILGDRYSNFIRAAAFISEILGVPFPEELKRRIEDADSRLAKLELARQNLKDVLSAIDEVEASAQKNKNDLEAVTWSLKEAQQGKETATAELASIQKLAELDAGAVRKALKIPTRIDVWRERIISFVLGVIASLAAAYIWRWVS